ncbi:MAG TPA: hypothetical protein VKT78_02765 [Fimbriimonadaceae bacterium]|nr:hypothetical protein [Fimbriimonadaceae bacterium]
MVSALIAVMVLATPSGGGSATTIESQPRKTDPASTRVDGRHKAPSGMVTIEFHPSATDPAITQFDDYHFAYFDKTAKSRGELLLVLPGTNNKPFGLSRFCASGAEAGYQVLCLMYPDNISADVVSNSKDRNAFADFRLEIIEGKNLSTYVHVDRTNSIENRLIKALRYLDSLRPRENWGRYLTGTGDINWEKIAVSGLSQGAGHAAFLAMRHKVARAVLFGGPKDFDKATNTPASWYTKSPATSTRQIYTFNHQQDHQGCTFAQQLENCKAIGLDALGSPVDVDKTSSPFRNSHILTTNYPGTHLTSDHAHTSVVIDSNTPIDKDGTPHFQLVWHYMLVNDNHPARTAQPGPRPPRRRGSG